MAYFVADAPGYYGDYASVYSSHETADAAITRRRGKRRLAVYSDGGFTAEHQKDRQIHRSDLAKYQRVDA